MSKWFICRIDKAELAFLKSGAGGMGWTTNWKKACWFETKKEAKFAISYWDELSLFKDILDVGKELS